MKALLTAAVVMIAIQPAFAQPRTPAETADCVITESAYYRQRLIREFPEPRNQNDLLMVTATKAIADAIASKCAVVK